MATTIKIKSTTTAGKIPTTSDLEIAELGLNLADEKLYSRNASGIFEIGKPGEVPSGGTPDRPAVPELGDLFYDITIDALLYWNGTDWVPVGNEAVALNDLTDVDTTGVTDGMVIAYDQASGEWKPVNPASLSVDVDLGYTPAADSGLVTNTAGDDATIPGATSTEAGLLTAEDKRKLDGIEEGAEANPDLDDYLQKGDNVSDLVNDAGYITDADVGDGEITIVDADGGAVGSFTVNQAGDTEITLPEIPAQEDQIHIGDTYPGTPNTGDLWVDTTECPPVLQIWSDCDGTEEWKPIGGGTSQPIAPEPDEITASPNFQGGSGTELDPYILAPLTVAPAGAGTQSLEVITIAEDGATVGQPVIWTNNSVGSGIRFNQPTGYTGIDGTWSGRLVYLDTPDSLADQDYIGNLQIGNVYFRWTITQKIAEGVINKPTVLAPSDGAGSGVTRDIVTDAITAVEGGGIEVCETELIESVESGSQYYSYNIGNLPADYVETNSETQEEIKDKLNAYSASKGGVNLFTLANNVQNDIPVGTMPNPAVGCPTPLQAIYEFNKPVIATISRYSPIATHNWYLMGSDDGITWYSAAQSVGGLPGPYPNNQGDTRAFADRPYKYYIFSGPVGNSSTTFYFVETALAEGSVLTFPSAEGFDCFEPGDVVQIPPTPIELDDSKVNKFTNPENAFDNDLDTYAEIAYDGSSAFLHFTIPTGVTTISCIVENTNPTDENLFYIQPGKNTYTNSGTWTETNGFFTTTNYIKVPPNSGKVQLAFALPANVNVARYYPDKPGFRIYATPDAALPPVKIISIDDSDPFTITVDGGDWAGTNGVPADQNQSQIWSENVVSSPNPLLQNNGFDGNTSTTFTQASDGTTYKGRRTITFNNLNVTMNSSLEVVMYAGQNTASYGSFLVSYNDSAEVPVTLASLSTGYGSLANYLVDWKSLLSIPNGTTINKLALKVDSIGTLADQTFAIIVDGQILVDAAGDTKLVKETPYDTKLTLAGAKDLDALQVGNVVKMGMDADVPYQPISDSIVSVDILNYGGTIDNPHPNSSQDVAVLFDGTPFEMKFDSTNVGFHPPYQVPGSTGTVTFSPNLIADSITHFSGGTSGCPITVYYADGSTQDIISAVKNVGTNATLVESQFNNTSGITSIVFGSALVGADSEWIAGFKYASGDAVTNTDSTLTLSGDTDLAYFRPGDLVQDDRTWLQGDWTAVTTKSGGSSSTISRMFDGNYTTRFNSSGGAYGEVTTNLPVSAGDTLNVYAWSSATTSSFSIKFTFDDSSIVEWLGPFTSTPTLNVEKIVPVGATYIEKIRFTGTSSNGVGVAGITVNNLLLVDNGITGDPGVEVPILYINTDNNQMTVDGGNWAGTDGSGNGGWNQSQVWSSICTYVNGSTSRPLSLFFNGQLDQELYALSRKRATITFPSVVPATTGEIYGKINGATDSQWILEINGVEVTQGSDNDWTSIDTALAVEGGLKTISFGDNGSGTYPHIYGIKLDGKLLVDQGIAGAPISGDTKVTCLSPLKAPTDWTVEIIDTDNNQLSLSHATPDANDQVWVANDNQAGTDFYVTGPSIADEPLLTADVRLQSSLFATTPPNADTLKNIVWELNGAEQNAGTSNPYTPSLNTNTTYTVRVKHQGNTLEDSPWSDQTTFTTGATRNLYTYYKERVEVLENRLAGLEADEVVDDATDVTLLTAVANLVQRVEALEGGA